VGELAPRAGCVVVALMTPAPVFLHHPSSLAHKTGAHPERAARIVAIEEELARRDWLGFSRVSSPPVERETLTAVHRERYVELIERACARGGGALDLDTVVSEGSFEAALHSAGGAVRLVDLLLDGAAPTGFSSHRPPGHHAEPGQAMGFCLFNNIAVAARHAVSGRGLERVLILDWDVHHGNGTNDVFRAAREVLFISIHQRGLWPGTGPVTDVGVGDAAGYTVNLPVAAGSGDAVYASLVEHVAVPLARAYQPQLVLLSAGYDAHRDDPLASCSVTDAGFAAMTSSMRRVCAELEVPLGGVLEGGYDLGALARSVVATLEVLGGAPGAFDAAVSGEALSGEALSGEALSGEALAVVPEAVEARRRLEEWWPGLG
jgi:acetoin utilization deacetylase AcuC-like enzyme